MRLLGNASVSALSVLAGAAIVAACGSSPRSNFSSTDGGSSGSSGGGGSSGGSSGGFLGDSGLFGDAGKDSGPVIPPKGCDSSCGAANGKCQNNVCVITENPGGISSGVIGQLNGGGTADSTFGWLYPYDKTVFARGLLSPTMQFNGTSADAMYVHITGASLDYKGYLAPASGGSLGVALPGVSWTAVAEAAGALPDQLQVQVTKISGGQVTGPITEHWPVAQGNLRGTIYYETYDSTLQTTAGALGGVGIMQIQPGALQPTILKSGCGNICHTASADGSTLVASQGEFDVPSASYNLKSSAVQIAAANDARYSYAGLYPDGSFGMSATNYRLWIPGGPPSRLYDTTNASATSIPANGWDGAITNAGTPAFSPDGKQIAFIREDAPGNGHTISKMDFTLANHSFANLADLATDPSTMLGWPAFTPDGKWVTYQGETAGTCSGSSAGPLETDCNSHANLFISDVASHTVQRLDALNGYTGSGTTSYLPSNDPTLNFAPTVLPEAVGGFFWVVFTSHRAYGNMIASMAPGADGTPDELGQLWVAAIDQDAKPGQDPSHPAFHLDGQEIAANNLRGFWVLPPCKQQGASCISGDECCQGFCRASGDAGNGPLECVPPPGGCSNDYEKCTTSADCCNPADQCINNLCAQPSAQ